MKKLTKKLLLSAITLGLALVTLTTTTFAWYTSSTQAKAINGSASTSSTTKDASLLISSDEGTEKEFSSQATIAQQGVNLVPLQYDTENKYFKELNASTEYKVEGQVAGFYEFKLYFKSNNNETVDVYIENLKIVNTNKNNLTKFDSLKYVAGNNTDGLPNEAKYYVDAVNALDLIIKNNNTSNNFFNYDLSGKITDTASSFGFGETETPNAIAYYNAFMENDITAPTSALEPFVKTASIGTIPAGGILEVTFVIYLNGWDVYCFDACRGQSFSVNIDFTTVAPTE